MSIRKLLLVATASIVLGACGTTPDAPTTPGGGVPEDGPPMHVHANGAVPHTHENCVTVNRPEGGEVRSNVPDNLDMELITPQIYEQDEDQCKAQPEFLPCQKQCLINPEFSWCE